jgi:nitrite reductase (NO-forming)
MAQNLLERNDRATSAPSAPATVPPMRPRGVIGGAWWTVATAIAITALVFALIGVFTPVSAGQTGHTSAAAAGPPQAFTVELGEFYVRPAVLDVAPGRPIELTVHNGGTMAHDLKLNGTIGTNQLNPGSHATVTFPALTADAKAWCTTPGHQAAGIELLLKVAGASAGTTGTATAAVAPTGAQIDFNAVPPPDWKPFDPTLRPADRATEHAVTFHATETVLPVAPGVTQEMWTFNGQVPGPIVRGHVGDLFTVTLVNDGKIGHSIDFHASRVAWNDEMRTINPGESLVYQFKADYAGIFMYHCGTAPALHHIGNGMFGAVIIDPPALAPVAHEYVLVQSELYTGVNGAPGDLVKMQHEAWDAVVFNGYVNQYKHVPIRVEPNERVRVWVLDAGPSENSSFHIVGTIFDTVFKEGAYLLTPDASHGGSQALDLQPAQGGFVEFSLAENGLYPIVTHKFANVGKGALGLFQAGDVQAAPAAGH